MFWWISNCFTIVRTFPNSIDHVHEHGGHDSNCGERVHEFGDHAHENGDHGHNCGGRVHDSGDHAHSCS